MKMMSTILDTLPRLLAVCLLASRCAGAILEQAPSYPVFSPAFEAITGPGYLQAISTNSCVANNDCTNYANVWFTNVSATESNGRVNLTFAIAGGSNGLTYDVFATTALASPLSNAVWTWMGQGYQGVTYTLPGLTPDSVCLLLGTPLDSDGDGLTDAYELLVGHSNPSVSNSIDPSMLDGWAVLWSLNPFAIYDQADFPSAPKARLDYWRFNTSTYQSEAGLLPGSLKNVSLVPSWSGTALCVTNLAGWLAYPAADSSGPSFNCGNGTIRFWYMPFFSSGSTNESSAFQSFFDFSSGNDSWSIGMEYNQRRLSFNSGSNSGVLQCHVFQSQESAMQFQSNLWCQITLTYSPTNFAFYTNGVLSITGNQSPTSNSVALFGLGNGIVYYPATGGPSGSFSFGNNNSISGGAPVDGLLDELETFNYPLTPQAVAAGFPAFAGSTYDVMTDSDYDGRSDMLEILVDGTNPNDPASVVPCRLGYWRFDSDSFMAEQGQLPLSYSDVSLAPSWSGTALNINSDPASQITYWDVFTNGWANINCRQGCLRFWFKPNWTSHPASSAPFVYLGNPDAASSQWSLNVNSSGAITLVTTSNSITETKLTSAPLPFDSGHWMQIVLNYGPTGTSLYTNGMLAATGSPVTHWPDLADRNLGMVIGNNTAYDNSINGQFDEMETFNYQLAPSNILGNFQIVQAVDSDLDGIPDLLEEMVLPVSRPFLGSPVVIVGTVEAEQFDMGGPGIAYHNMAANPPSSYRPTGMFITNCDDLGLGYCLDQTRPGDWAQYTVNVLVPQTYTIETRVEGIGTNGVFECEFTNNAGFYTNTGPLAITSTNWTNLSAMVHLPAGTNVMKLHCLASGSDGAHVGRFNYISIYAWWQPGFTSTQTNTITAGQLSTNNDFLDASNNAAIIQSSVNAIGATGGGTVLLPVGTYYVSQAAPNETNLASENAAVTITNDNVEIAGAGKTNTTLVAYNRATTVLSVGIVGALLPSIPCTNFTMRDMTIEAQPHLAVANVTNTVLESGQLLGGRYTGFLTLFQGISTNQLDCNILISNCQFLYGDVSIGIVYYVSNCLISHCDFKIWGGSNVYTGAVNNPPNPNTTNYNGSVGIFCAGSPDYNVNILENTYNGNTNLVPNPNNPFGYASTNLYQFNLAPDGFVYFQCGGNIFIARNTILNYNFEGVQVVGGPNSVVGNTLYTLVSGLSCCALAVNQGGFGGLLGTNPITFSTCFVGNQVYGGRNGESPQGAVPGRPFFINFSGNSLTLYPPFASVDDYPGEAVGIQACTQANVFGNTLVSGGHGVQFGPAAGTALIMDNNFANVTYRGIGQGEFGGAVQSASIFNNVLGQGSTFHLQLPLTNNFGWFLQQNQYLNAASNSVPPFIDPAGSAVHLSD
jgi:hypothetical protein